MSEPLTLRMIAIIVNMLHTIRHVINDDAKEISRVDWFCDGTAVAWD